MTALDEVVKRPRGRPKGSKNKKYVNSAAKKKNINPKDAVKCLCCGLIYPKKSDNFPTTRSPLYAENDGYLPICKDCVAKYYLLLFDFFDKDPYAALERCCQLFDWYYNERIADSILTSTGNKNPATGYPGRAAMSQHRNLGDTYLDTIKDRADVDIGAIVKPDLALKSKSETYKGDATGGKVEDDLVNKWGNRCTAEEVRVLEDHYQMLHQTSESISVVQESLIFDLCRIHLMKMQALNAKNFDDYNKMATLYQKTLTTANLEPKKKDNLSKELETWGTLTGIIEQYTPAEYYKDKKLFQVFDGIKDSIGRFLLRPMRNMFFGTRDMDAKYSIKDGDAE